VLSALEATKDHWPGTKDEAEARVGNLVDIGSGDVCQVTESRKYSETSNHTECTIAKRDDNRVEKRWFLTRTVRAVGGHGAKGEWQGKEDLCHSPRPDIRSFAQNGCIPATNVLLDTVIASFQAHSLEQEDEQEYDGQSHGKVGHTTGPFQTKCQAEKDSSPNKGGVTNIGPHDAGGTSIFSQTTRTNDVIDKVPDGILTSDTILRPGIVIAKGFKKGSRHPTQQHGVINDEHETQCDTAQADATQTSVKTAIDTDIARLMVLSEGNFEKHHGQADQKEGQNVGNEKGSASEILGEGGKAPYVAKTDSRSDGSQVKGRTGGPTVAIGVLVVAKGVFGGSLVVGRHDDEDDLWSVWVRRKDHCCIEE